MRSRTTRRFRACLADLPQPVQRQARDAYRLWLANPRHPSLQFKKLSTTNPVHSVRIGPAYRALAVRDDDTLVWFWIGSHADYDRLIKQF